MRGRARSASSKEAVRAQVHQHHMAAFVPRLFLAMHFFPPQARTYILKSRNATLGNTARRTPDSEQHETTVGAAELPAE